MNNISPCWCCIYEKYKLKLFVVVLVIIHTSTSVAGDCKISNKLLAFFNVKDGIYLTFAHAVNSQSKLRLALDDPSIMILEADILMDPVKNIPIMAHPPATSSDLTLSQFLSKVLASKSARGMKLDFKQIEVVEPSLKIFKKALADAKLSSGKLAPIMLNADILAGPNDPQKVPVKATSFISHCKSDDSSILSTGWTTSKENSKSEGIYSFIYLLKNNNENSDLFSLCYYGFMSKKKATGTKTAARSRSMKHNLDTGVEVCDNRVKKNQRHTTNQTSNMYLDIFNDSVEEESHWH